MKARWLGAGMLAASVLALPMAAQAQDWRRDGDRRYDDYYGSRTYRSGTFRYGFDRGYNDGAKRGERDARGRHGFDFRNERDYRDADNGYRGSYGPRWEYSRGYRDGYENGYRESFRRYARGWNGSYWNGDRWNDDRRY